MGKKSRSISGSGKNIPDHISESLLETIFGLKYLNSLMWIRIRDYPGSATLIALHQEIHCPYRINGLASVLSFRA
jgi:hypothetical protein